MIVDPGPGLLSAGVTFFRRNDVHETIRPLHVIADLFRRLEACTTMLGAVPPDLTNREFHVLKIPG